MLARWFNDAFTKIFLKNGKQVATTGLKIMPSVTKKCPCFDFKKTWWWQRNSSVYLFDDLFANTNKISASIAVFQLRFNSSSKATRVIWYLFTSGTEENSLFKCSSFRILYKRRRRVPNETNCEQKYWNRNTIDSSFS